MIKRPAPPPNPTERRHFPIVWRAAALLLIVLTVAIAGAALITRATRMGTDCLLVNGDPETILWDLHTGIRKRIPVPTFQPPQDQNDVGILSPDRLHSMEFAQAGLIGAKTFPAPVLSSQTYHYFRWGNSDDSWSPDSNWFAHMRYKDGSATGLIILDKFGNQKNIHVFSLKPDEQLQVDDWSPDSQYLVTLTRPLVNSYQVKDITFWHIPDLHPIRPFDNPDNGWIPLSGCYGRGNSDTYEPMFCVNWLTKDHHAMFSMNNKLIIFDPSQGIQKEINLIDNDGSQTFYISPNNRYIAIATAHISYQTTLYVYDIATKAARYVDTRMLECSNYTLCDDEIYVRWSPDSQTLFYVGNSLYRTDQFDLVRYRLDIGSPAHILSLDNSAVGFSTSENPPVFVVSRDQHTLLYFGDGRVAEYPGDVFSIVNSPDASRFVMGIHGYTGRDELDIVVFDQQGNFRAMLNVKKNTFLGSPNTLVWTDCSPAALNS